MLPPLARTSPRLMARGRRRAGRPSFELVSAVAHGERVHAGEEAVSGEDLGEVRERAACSEKADSLGHFAGEGDELGAATWVGLDGREKQARWTWRVWLVVTGSAARSRVKRLSKWSEATLLERSCGIMWAL